MKKTSKKVLAWLLCLTLLFTMSTGITFAAEDQTETGETDTITTQETAGTGITITAGDEEYSVTDADIKAATKAEATAESPWKKNAKTAKTYTGTFYSLKSILESKSIDVSDVHGITTKASDGFTNGFTKEEIDNIYIYELDDVTEVGSENPVGAAGKYGTAINDGAGNKWANDIVSIATTKTCVQFVKGGICQHYCAICGNPEPVITVNVAGETKTVYDCQIKAATVKQITEDSPWGYKTNAFVGNFYELSSILTGAGVTGLETMHGIVATASDGFTTGFAKDDLDNIYIYDQGEVLKNGTAVGTAGTYGTAIEGTAGPGNKWAKSISSISISDGHVKFHKGDKDYTYCAICGEELFGSSNKTLQELITEANDGETVTIDHSVDFGDDVIELDAGTKTVTLDIGEYTLAAKTIKVIGGKIKFAGTTGIYDAAFEASDTGKIAATSGNYTNELPSEYCDSIDDIDKVPWYDSEKGYYTMKDAASAYESQQEANILKKTIKSLQAQLRALTAEFKAGTADVTVKAAATAYNKVNVNWDCDTDDVVYKVKKNGEVITVEGKAYVDTAVEPGITNTYSVAAGVKYEDENGEEQVAYGKFVSTSATTGIGKSVISTLKTKSKKLTVGYKAVAGADSYDIWIGTNSAVTKGVVKYNNVKKLSVTSKTLKKNKKYYVKVRAHVTNSARKVVYGSWSAVKSIKCK